jgi:hypothetical protein
MPRRRALSGEGEQGEGARLSSCSLDRGRGARPWGRAGDGVECCEREDGEGEKTACGGEKFGVTKHSRCGFYEIEEIEA